MFRDSSYTVGIRSEGQWSKNLWKRICAALYVTSIFAAFFFCAATEGYITRHIAIQRSLSVLATIAGGEFLLPWLGLFDRHTLDRHVPLLFSSERRKR